MFAKITINGVELTVGQAMTVHVALQNFAIDMKQPDALGDDHHGKVMRESYLNRIAEINKIILSEG
jgi:hypothetical protein